MYFYFILIAYHIGLWVFAQWLKPSFKNKLLLSLAFVLPLILMCSFKAENIGLDTTQYKDIYHSISTRAADSIETGFYYFTKLISLTGIPYTLYLLVSYLITFIPVAFFAVLKCDKPISFLFIFTYVGFFGFAISGLRQSISIGIALIGFCFFRKDRVFSIIFPLVSSLLAFTFHKSGFVFLIIIGLSFIKINKIAAYYIIAVSTILGILSTFIYTFVYEVGKIGNVYVPVVSTTYFSLAIYIALLLLLIIIRTKWFERFDTNILGKADKFKVLSFFRNTSVSENRNKADYSSLLFVIFSALILAFGANTSVMARFIYCAAPFAFLSVVNDFKLLNSKTSKTLMGLGLVGFSSLYFIAASLIKDPLQIANYRFGFIV